MGVKYCSLTFLGFPSIFDFSPSLQPFCQVGEYDSDDDELWHDDEDDADEISDNDSWETESEVDVEEEVKEEDLHNDAKDLKPKLAANIEKARVAMSRLEEIFSENATLQTQEVMKQLLDVYRDCKQLDRLMGTFFFDESNFGGLLDRIRDQDRISSMEAGIKDHLTRLFSVDESSGTQPIEEAIGAGTPLATDATSSENSIPDSKVCGSLCSMIKSQLLKLHEEVVRRFGHFGEEEGGEASSTSSLPLEAPTSLSVTTDLAAPEMEDLTAAETLKSPLSPLTPGPNPLDPASVLSPGSFQMVESVPDSHKFKLTLFQPVNMKLFLKTVRQEMKLLSTSLPPGIIVKGYEDRMDLFSAMIHGPKSTPYEDGLFFFDFQLPSDYPASPPSTQYISFCSDRLNPNLYEDGKVCVSLLGTWQGKGTETWSHESNLLQLLVSIQGLILVREPYFNEAGYEKQKGAQQGSENSRMYNEMAVLKMVQSMTRLLKAPQPPFQEEVRQHFKESGSKFVKRLETWKAVSEEQGRSLSTTPTSPAPSSFPEVQMPDFPLIPASRGFCLTLGKALTSLVEALKPEPPTSDLPLD